MPCLQKTYRLLVLFASAFLAGPQSVYCQQAAPARTPDKQSVAPVSKAAVDAGAGQQSAMLAAMAAAIDKQREAARKQIGSTVTTDAFFSTPWATPATITPPALIPACSPMPDAELAPIVASNAKDQAVKPELIRAVIRRESASYPCAVSDRGALGLMQLMPDVAARFKADPLDPLQNVRAGTQYLKQLLDRYKGDIKLALAAYNAGPERVDADKKVPEIAETVAYVEGILKDLNRNSSSPH